VDKLGNVFSQFGEDQIIQDHLSRLWEKNLADRWSCEFGAWDGLHFSNTANLILNYNYSGVLIEPDSRKFQLLKQNMEDYQTILINDLVALEGANSLDNLLSDTPIPMDFDLLSIDIDGADYWIFESMLKFRPKIIVIEFNPSIPKEVEFVNPRDIRIKQGSSVRSILLLAENKNYRVSGVTTCNVFLIDEKYSHLFADKLIHLQNLKDPIFVNRMWQTYDGRIHTQSNLNLFWHDLKFPNRSMQLLPNYFLFFPDSMSKIRYSFFLVWRKFQRMIKFFE